MCEGRITKCIKEAGGGAIRDSQQKKEVMELLSKAGKRGNE